MNKTKRRLSPPFCKLSVQYESSIVAGAPCNLRVKVLAESLVFLYKIVVVHALYVEFIKAEGDLNGIFDEDSHVVRLYYRRKDWVEVQTVDMYLERQERTIQEFKNIGINIDLENLDIKIPEDKIVEIIRKVFPLTPRGIIEHLQLRRPIFAKTAAYGHFGREIPEFTWEKRDMVEKIKALV